MYHALRHTYILIKLFFICDSHLIEHCIFLQAKSGPPPVLVKLTRIKGISLAMWFTFSSNASFILFLLLSNVTYESCFTLCKVRSDSERKSDPLRQISNIMPSEQSPLTELCTIKFALCFKRQ